MAGGNDADKLSYSEQEVDKASVIFDVVALPPVTPLIRYARERGKTVITGSEVFAISGRGTICPLYRDSPGRRAVPESRGLVTSVTFFSRFFL